ncbi:peptide deformylase [Arthrobacter sulfonylureivorans]|uniref:Peptide deformylase n=1 Tax=Arthrobacter sulfonylureivorans TaxID=2486855 RepID=A0ABY3W336_9MICC|nr:peptide deformylase [Arthrobacter sulfonylureivorans]UNK44425.1 peptide deformylase [Arthrobacter sulfonylureivorans]
MTDYSAEQLRDLVHTLAASGEPAPILQIGEPVLRRQAAAFDGQLDTADLTALLGLMRRTMQAAPGVGLAAPQIGIPLRIAVLEDTFDAEPEIAEARHRAPLPYCAIINPSYRAVGEETAAFYEGCLSFAGFQGVVERHRSVELDYDQPDGSHRRESFTGWQARIVQHETDHLSGTIYVDKMLPRSLCGNAEYFRYWAQPTVDQARAGLNFQTGVRPRRP